MKLLLTPHGYFTSVLGAGSWILTACMVLGAVVRSLQAAESKAAVLWADPELKSYYWENPGFTNIWDGELVVRDAISISMTARAPHGLALRADGTVNFWGYSTILSNGVPSNLRGVVAVAPLESASVALLDDGSLVAWTAPEGPLEVIESDVKAVAQGDDHVVALKADGTVRTWSKRDRWTTPQGLRDVVSVVAAGNLAGALRADGTVATWTMPIDENSPFAPPASLSDVVRLYAGKGNLYAVRRDGSLVTWGWFTQSAYPLPDPDTLQDVVQVAEHDSYALFLRANGTVTAWGWMWWKSSNVRARVPAGLSNVVAVAAGLTSALALKSDGTLVSWYGSPKPSPIPAIVSVNVTSIQAAGFMRLAVGVTARPEVIRPPEDCTVHQWQSGQFEVGARGFGLQFQWYTNAVAVPRATDPKFHVDGTIVGLSEGLKLQVSVEVESPDGQRVSSGPAALRVVPTIQPGTVLEWGPGGASERVIPTEVQGRTVAISQGVRAAGAILDNGTVCAWTAGKAPYRRETSNWPWIRSFGVGGSEVGFVLGDGTATIENPFEQVPPITLDPAARRGAASITMGDGDYDVIVLEDGTVRTSGHSSGTSFSNVRAVSYTTGLFGLLMRDGTVQFPNSTLNTQAKRFSGIVSIATGWGHALLLRGDGTLVAIGNNIAEQCTVPPGLDHVVAVAAGHYHSVALRDDGTVFAWGRLFPNWPDLGPGEPASIPAGLRDVTAISAKRSQTLFLLGTPVSPRTRLVKSPDGIEAVWPTPTGVWVLQSSAGLFPSSWETRPEPQETSGPWSHTRLSEGPDAAFLRLTRP